MLEIGKTYIAKRAPSNRREEPSFISIMERFIGIPMILKEINNGYAIFDNKDYPSLKNYSWHPNWVEPHDFVASNVNLFNFA